MANGREPNCVTCKNFKAESTAVSQGEPVNVRSGDTRSICKFHKVYLPLAQTNDLLVCRDWHDYRSDDRLADWSSLRPFEPGILYAFKSMYEPKLTFFANLEELPRAEV